MVRLHFDAGHGGNDSGAVANNMKEKDITLAVCLKVEEKLKEYKDVEVFQTRTSDITQSLSQKSSIVNSKGNLDFCLSVHVNAAGGTGAEIWLQEAIGKAYEYAKTIVDEYCAYTGAKNRYVKTGDLHMNREVKCNSNLIELAFIDSPSSVDINLLKDIDKMAQGVVNGLVKCFGLVKNTTNTSSTSSTGSKTSNFINKLAPMAVADYKVSGVLPSLTIAQAILESGWGESELAVKANNLFGIKADSRWTGKVYNTQTKEYYNNSNTPATINANFRSYDSWEGGVKDHSEFLQADRYNKVVGAKDYKVACEEVYKAGYATDPNYTSKLIKLIEDYNLYKYDENNTSTSTGVNNLTPVKVGDKVKVKTTATHYATGQAIASFVKGNTYTVREVSSNKILLDEIMSWVLISDVDIVSSSSNNFTPYRVRITCDVLNVRADATTNSKIVTTVKRNEVYTIIGEKNDFLQLKSGSGYIHKDYTVKC